MSLYARAISWLSRFAPAAQHRHADAPADAAAFEQRVGLALAAGQVAAAEQLCMARLAARGDDRAARLHLGHLLLHENRGGEALGHFRMLDALEGWRDVVTEAFTSERLDIERVRRGEPHFRWLENVRVETAYWTVMRDGCVYNEDVHAKNLATSPFVRGRVSADGALVIASLPSVARAIEQECILVGGDDNYSHWLFRNMLKLSSLDRAGLLYRYPWLVNSDLKNYQNEYLGLLGQQPERLLKVERNSVVACRRLLIPALHVNSRAISHGVAWIRERLAHLLVAPAQAARRLFISRRDNARRSVLNEDEVFAALVPFGFERVVPGEMSVVDQIVTFSGARYIVAAHGAALTNMIFAPPGAAIVELTSTAIEHMDLFRKLARSTQHEVTSLVSADYAAGTDHPDVNSDYRVDVAAVRAAVAATLQARL